MSLPLYHKKNTFVSCFLLLINVLYEGVYYMILEKNVVYASDERFVSVLATSIESLLRTNSNVNIYILNNGICEESIQKLIRQVKRYSKVNSEIFFIKVNNLEYYTRRELSCQSKISLTAYFRLFMADVLPKSINKILYLDCDTMVCKSLDELFQYELRGACGAVAEPTAPLMKNKIELEKKDLYFNSGVLFIDLKKWRDNNITQKYIVYIEEKKGMISFEDQGVINHVLHKQIDILPFKYNVTTQYYDFGYDGFNMMKKDYNVYGKDEVENALKNPWIVHFTNSFASERPWVNGSSHKFKNEWINIRQETEWNDNDLWGNYQDIFRRISRVIYRILPGNTKYRFIYLVNGVLRAWIKDK